MDALEHWGAWITSTGSSVTLRHVTCVYTRFQTIVKHSHWSVLKAKRRNVELEIRSMTSSPRAALTTSLVFVAPQASCDYNSIATDLPFAVKVSMFSDDEPGLKDDILYPFLANSDQKLQDLASFPRKMKVSDEVAHQRVKKLLDESTSNKKHTDFDNATAFEETARLVETSKYNEIGDKVKKKAEKRDVDAMARDLDTMRSEFVGSEVFLEEFSCGETVEEGRDSKVNIALTSTPKVDVEMRDDTANAAVSVYETDKTSVDSDDSTQATSTLDAVSAGGINEMIHDAEVADAPFVSSDPEKCSNGLAAYANLQEGSVVETKALIYAAKRQKRAEYPVETRALCVRRHQTEGVSYATISKELGIPHDTVRAIVRKAKRTGSVASAPRSGRPRKTSGIVDKVILEAVRSNKQCSAKTIQEELLRVYGVKLSPETVRRRVLEHTKQRIQSISGGTLSEATPLTTKVEEKTAHTSTAVSGPSAARLQGKLLVLNTSLPDLLSCRQMLHGAGQLVSADEQLGLSSIITSSTTDVMQSALTAGRLSTTSPADEVATVTVAAAASASVDPEIVQPATSSQRDDEPSTQWQHKRGEYSIETREQCVALHRQGQGYRRIGKALNMPHTTVRAIVEKAQRTGTVLPGKRSGRPRKTDAIVDKVILQAVKANERSSARIIKEQLVTRYGVRVSCETIRRRVKDHNRQCMSAAGSIATSGESRLLAVAITDFPSVAAANLMTFDENGVHI